MTDKIVYEVHTFDGGDGQKLTACYFDEAEAQKHIDKVRAQYPTYHAESLASLRKTVVDTAEVVEALAKKLTPLERLVLTDKILKPLN